MNKNAKDYRAKKGGIRNCVSLSKPGKGGKPEGRTVTPGIHYNENRLLPT
jgi:hypothetical protein